MRKIDFNFYENYVCPYCYNVITECTCDTFPPWSLTHIDRGLQKTIRTLNQKGYHTKYCCESHYDYSFAIMITFADNVKFSCLPEGFVFNKQKRCLYHDIKFFL